MQTPAPTASGAIDSVLPVVPQRRLHPIYLLITTANTVWRAIPYLVLIFVGGAPWWVNIALFVLIMIVAIAQWFMRKYSVAGGHLQVESGIVNRQVRLVPVTRITALTAHRSFVQRLVGVWGLYIQSPGDRHGSLISLGSLSTRRVDELVTALEGQAAGDPTGPPATPASAPTSRTRALRQGFSRGALKSTLRGTEPEIIAALDIRGMLVAAVTNNTIPLLVAAALVVWIRFSDALPARTKDFVESTILPLGWVATLVIVVVAAIVAGVLLGALRLYKFTLIRDGDTLRTVRGLLSKQSGSFPVERIQAVRIVEGIVQVPLGLCSLQVEVAGVGRANANNRTVYPLLRTAHAAALVRRALPELEWPTGALRPVPREFHRRYLTVPLWWGLGFTVALLLLPDWWKLLAALPIPLAIFVGVRSGREAAWRLDAESLSLRWRRVLVRNTVVARRFQMQQLEWSSSPWKARAGIAGFRVRFSSGRSARVRYLPDGTAGTLLRAVGRR
jgi:putative membrane protein